MPVERPAVLETTGVGAAFLAGLGTGVWSSTDELAATWRVDAEFSPGRPSADATTYEQWRAAVERAKGWAAD
jgi:glycerol kinase